MVRWLLGYFHYFRAEMQPLREIVAQLADRASDGRESLTVIESHRASGVTLVELGRCQEALAHLDKVSRSTIPSGPGHACRSPAGIPTS